MFIHRASCYDVFILVMVWYDVVFLWTVSYYSLRDIYSSIYLSSFYFYNIPSILYGTVLAFAFDPTTKNPFLFILKKWVCINLYWMAYNFVILLLFDSSHCAHSILVGNRKQSFLIKFLMSCNIPRRHSNVTTINQQLYSFGFLKLQ